MSDAGGSFSGRIIPDNNLQKIELIAKGGN